MIRKVFTLALLCACLVANNAIAIQLIARHSNSNISNAVIAGELGKEIDEYLTRLTGFGYSGSMLVVKGGKTVLRRGYGLADKEKNIPNRPETVFDIGSLSKQFTAAAILKLEMTGKLKVSDPISKYLPNAPSGKQITIHQLLSHTSGLVRGVRRPDEISRDQMIGRIFSRPLESEPGSRFAYSNAGYVLLAAIVESASGEPFREFVKKNLLDPVGMRSTGFQGKYAPSVAPHLIARGYDDFGREGHPLEWSSTSWRDLGEGQMTSTVDDLYKWHLALKGERMLSREAKEKMWTPVLKNYGYGWWIDKTPHGNKIWHGGDSDGFGSMLSWFPDEQALIIGLCNIRHDWYPTHVSADECVPKIVFGESYNSPPAFIKADPKVIDRIAGVYQLDSGGTFVLRIERGELQIGAKGQDAVDVLREGDENSLKARADLTANTKTILEAYLKGDMTPLAKAGGTDPDFLKSIGDEIKEIGKDKGPLRSLFVLGSFPAGEPGIQNTIVQLNYERGPGFYKFRWDHNHIQGTYTKTPDLAAITPLEARSKTELAGWNILEWETTKGFNILLDIKSGSVTGFTLSRGNQQWQARRIKS